MTGDCHVQFGERLVGKFHRSTQFDLVQLNPEPIGETLGAIHDLINPWMGQPKVKRSEGRATMVYRALSELESKPISIKIEINTRDHDNLLPKLTVPFSVKNKWFNGDAQINTYQLEELMATKLRALYQRKKGRDLFDFFAVIKEVGHLDLNQTITCFEHYMRLCDSRVTKAQFQQNLEQKRKSKIFNADMRALLPSNIIYDYDVEWTYKYLFDQILSLLPGEPWKGLN